MKKDYAYLLTFTNLAAWLGMVLVNALANVLPINNISTGEISAMYPNLFVPAGLTFSIWGVIYLLLLCFLVYHFVVIGKKKKSRRPFMQKISLLFMTSSMLNIGWIFAWHHYQTHLSVIIMILLLLNLLLIYRRLEIGKSTVPAAERYLVHLPFSIYLGWISVATIANITALLVSVGWTGWGLSPQVWAVIMIVTASLLAVIAAVSRRDIYFGLVVVWALAGIMIRHYASPEPPMPILFAALLCAGMILLVHLIMIIKKRVY
jgi:hypothetical protein